mgnify:FL=1
MASNSKNLAELLNSDLTLTTTDIANGAVTTAKIADGAITPVKTAGLASAGKNLIINGDMKISQRGTSFASLTSGYAFNVDRFARYIHLVGTWTMSQSTDTPTGLGFSNSLKVDCTTARGSLDASSELVVLQRIEGQDLQLLKKGTSSAEKLTVSFWVKSAKTGTYILELFDHTNSRTINKSYTISSANTWEKKTVTFEGDTTGALANTSAVALQLNFWLAQGSNWQSGTLQTSWGSAVTANRGVGQVNLADSTANDWYLTGVQMEVGETATDFEHRSFVEQYNRCKRYYQRVNADAAYDYGAIALTAGTNSAWYVPFPFDGPMRADPTLSYSAVGNFRVTLQHSDSTACTGIVIGYTHNERIMLSVQAGTNNASNGTRMFGFNGASAGWIAFHAEL